MEDIAAACGLNRSYFGKIFHENMGKSPQDFLISYRMSKATELLRLHGDIVLEVLLDEGNSLFDVEITQAVSSADLRGGSGTYKTVNKEDYFWMGGVSIISGTLFRVRREPFPTSKIIMLITKIVEITQAVSSADLGGGSGTYKAVNKEKEVPDQVEGGPLLPVRYRHADC